MVLLPLLGRAPAAGFSRELSDRARLAAPRHLARRDRARRQAHLPSVWRPFRGVKSVAEQIGRAENGQDPGRAQQERVRGADRSAPRATTRARSRPRIREVFDDFPNQLVEIYSVLAERIGETLSGESAPFFVSVFGSGSRRATIRSAAQIAAVLRASARTAATCA